MSGMPPAKDTFKARYEAVRFQLWIVWLHLVAVLILGLALIPALALIHGAWRGMAGHPHWLRLGVFGLSMALGYFVFGACLILCAVLAKTVFRFRIKPGLFTIHSDDALSWMGYNSMILVVNSAFLDVLRLSPFQTLFYRLMGARIGRGVNINTGGLADLSMLEIGDNVLVGGGVALICHGSERGFLRLAPTRIGSGVSIGLNTVIMPDCQIGDGASIAPCSYLPKGTRVPPRGVWGGNPVRDLRLERRQALAEGSDS